MPELGEAETVGGRLLAMIVGGSDVALSLPLHSPLAMKQPKAFAWWSYLAMSLRRGVRPNSLKMTIDFQSFVN